MPTTTHRTEDRPVQPWNLAALLLIAGAALIAAGCNTTKGVGQDMQSVGEAIEDAADDAKD